MSVLPLAILVWMCACRCTWVCRSPHKPVEARGTPWLLFTWSVSPCSLRQFLFMAWNSLFGRGWLASKLQCSLVSASPGLGSQHRQPRLDVCPGFWGWNSGPGASHSWCVAIPITPAPHLVFLSEPQERVSLRRLVTTRAPAVSRRTCC